MSLGTLCASVQTQRSTVSQAVPVLLEGCHKCLGNIQSVPGLKRCESTPAILGPAGSVQYVSQAVPVLLEGCRDGNANVRQCSVYGLGVLAEHRPEHFRPIAGEAVARMLEMLAAPGSRCGAAGGAGPDA